MSSLSLISRSPLAACFAGQLVFCCLGFAQTLQPGAIQQIQTILREKASRTPAQRKLASHLHLTGQLARGVLNTATIPALGAVMKGLKFDGAGAVHVDIHATVNAALLAEITARGGRVE